MKHSPIACDDVLEYLCKQRLSLDDLINVGGEDLPAARALSVSMRAV